MKILKITIVILISIILLLTIYANPLPTYYIHELFLDFSNPYNWKIELSDIYTETHTLDGGYIKTNEDSASFKNGIQTHPDSIIVITNAHLTKPLFINPSGDIITLFSDEGSFTEKLRFGNVEYNRVAAPKPNQSIGRLIGVSLTGYYGYFYLDNSPTIGGIKDTCGGCGYLSGLVTDSTGNILKNVEIRYKFRWPMSAPEEQYEFVKTDKNGNFEVYSPAIIEDFKFVKEGYISPDTSIQIWPDSTVKITVVMTDTSMCSINSQQDHFANKYQLAQNYPNPFNNQTAFEYSIPLAYFVEITIYDIAGRKVKELYSGYQSAGNHHINWNAGGHASGVYLYQLKTSHGIINKKCLLIK